mmetsp:Transcript_28081/g.65487  ORF Transcript_28081/g.65487 Transcript_28081/m.65487 type:complete len:95 (+) Transcript_28081:520-804(+)
MVTAHVPFATVQNAADLVRIAHVQGLRPPLAAVLERWSAFAEILSGGWCHEPEQRLSAEGMIRLLDAAWKAIRSEEKGATFEAGVIQRCRCSVM